MNYKSLEMGIKNIDPEQRIVEGYLNTWEKDNVGDTIMPGAFKRTLKERGIQGTDEIQFCWNHDMSTAIGKFIELKEDDTGLFFAAKLTTTPKAEEAWTLYKDGILKAHSIGFSLVKNKWDYGVNKDGSPNYYERTIREIKLWEASATLFPANSGSVMTNLKSLLTENKCDNIEEFVDETLHLYKKGEISAEDIRQLKAICETQILGRLGKALDTEETDTQQQIDNQEQEIDTQVKSEQLIVAAEAKEIEMLNQITKIFKEI